MEDREVVEAYLAAAGAPDLEAYLYLWADSGRLEMPYHPDEAARILVGIDAIRARAVFARTMIEFMTVQEVSIEPMATPGRFVAEYSGVGRTVDGVEYRNRYCSLATVRDGKMVCWREYFNPAARATALEPQEMPADGEAVQ